MFSLFLSKEGTGLTNTVRSEWVFNAERGFMFMLLLVFLLTLLFLF